MYLPHLADYTKLMGFPDLLIVTQLAAEQVLENQFSWVLGLSAFIRISFFLVFAFEFFLFFHLLFSFYYPNLSLLENTFIGNIAWASKRECWRKTFNNLKIH